MYLPTILVVLVYLACVRGSGVLYIWCGQDKSVTNAADFVAVVNFDLESPNYGKIIKRVPLPANVPTLSRSENEAHHAQVSADYKYYITGGLLSFSKGTDEIFVWKVPQKPKQGPVFAYSLNPPGACTDEFVPIGGSKFLVTQMCDENAGTPGDIIHIDAETRSFYSVVANRSSIEGFNPHGFARSADGILTVANYIVPATLLASSASDLVFQDTVVTIDAAGNLKDTYTMPPVPAKTAGVGSGNGFMDFKYIPKDPLNRGYACGTNDNQMYLLQSGRAPLRVFDFSYLSLRSDGRGGLSAGIVTYSSDGKRMIMSLLMKWTVLLDISVPETPKVLQQFYWCNATALINKKFQIDGKKQTFSEFCATGSLPGTHYVHWPPGANHFVVINYFLSFGLAQFPGTRTVHAFKFDDNSHNSFSYDSRFNPNPQLSALSASPHAVTYFPTNKNGNLIHNG